MQLPFFEAIVGWTGQILTGSDVPECCLAFLCVILCPNWEVFEVKALHWTAKRGSPECRVALLSFPPSLYCTNDRTTCTSVRVRMSHMTEVVEEDTGMSARSWGAMWGWGVEWEGRGCVCLKLFSMIEKTFCNTFFFEGIKLHTLGLWSAHKCFLKRSFKCIILVRKKYPIFRLHGNV